jgi:hypothetical protein
MKEVIVNVARRMLQAAQKDCLTIEISFEDGTDPLYKGTAADKAWNVVDAFDPIDQMTIILHENGREVGRCDYAPYRLLGTDIDRPSGPWIKRWLDENAK